MAATTPPRSVLTIGARYRVTYRVTMRNAQTFVGTYLGWNRTLKRHEFHLRPKFPGKVTLPSTSFVEIELVGSEIEHSPPR